MAWEDILKSRGKIVMSALRKVIYAYVDSRPMGYKISTIPDSEDILEIKRLYNEEVSRKEGDSFVYGDSPQKVWGLTRTIVPKNIQPTVSKILSNYPNIMRITEKGRVLYERVDLI